jgi:hypothetical protein
VNVLKKASIEVGVNFLVVTIICLALLGIGIYLMSKFVILGQEQLGKVDEANQQRLIKLLSTGRVAVIPSIAYINRGETAKFSLGISNELGYDSYFAIYVMPRSIPPDATVPPEIQYSHEATNIKNNMNNFMLVGIKIPKADPKGTYVFNIYVCKDSCRDCCYEDPSYTDPYSTDKYGELQQVQINVK